MIFFFKWRDIRKHQYRYYSGNCLCVSCFYFSSIAYVNEWAIISINWKVKIFFTSVSTFRTINLSIRKILYACTWPQISCFNIRIIREIHKILATHDCMLWIWISLKACTTLIRLSMLAISSEKSTQLRSFASIPLFSLTWKPETLRDPLDLLFFQLAVFFGSFHVDMWTH